MNDNGLVVWWGHDRPTGGAWPDRTGNGHDLVPLEAIYFDRPLTDDERKAVSKYTESRWGAG